MPKPPVERAIEVGDRDAVPEAMELVEACCVSVRWPEGRVVTQPRWQLMAAKNWLSGYGAVILQMTLVNEDRLAEIDGLFLASQSRLVESGYLIAQPALQANSDWRCYWKASSTTRSSRPRPASRSPSR